MSGIRQRRAAWPTPPVGSIEELSAALKQAKESATARGVSEDSFSECVASVVQAKLKSSKEKPKSPQKPTCCSRLYFCFKIVWIVLLCVLGLCMITIVYKPAGFIAHKLLHRHMYSITRPIRLGVVSMMPYLSAVGLDGMFNSDCTIKNPLISDEDSCPCLYIKESIEIELNDTHRTIPDGILSVPNHNVYILRGAVDTSQFSLNAFEVFKNALMPDSCFEMTSEGSKGVQSVLDLFDRKVLEKYLKTSKPWSFNWQDCPSEDNPLSYNSLVPSHEWLPPDVTVSSSSFFILSSQWATTAHPQSVFENGERFLAVLVVLGEMRVMMDSPNPNCIDRCMGFRCHPVLRAGDVLLYDQRHWQYMAVTWSKAALTKTVTLTLN